MKPTDIYLRIQIGHSFQPNLFSSISTHLTSPTSKHSDATLDTRLLAGLVQDVWDKFYKLKLSVLSRQRHETEALWMVQLGQWVDRLGELGKECEIMVTTRGSLFLVSRAWKA